jgi:serine/threonine protein kinase
MLRHVEKTAVQDRYIILDKLGDGGFGNVCRAAVRPTDEENKENIAKYATKKTVRRFKVGSSL